MIYVDEFNKIVKGDKFKSCLNEDEIYTFLSYGYNVIKVRDRKGHIISMGIRDFISNMEKVYIWGKWRKDPEDEEALYKTNRKHIIYDKDDLKVRITCSKHDTFDLDTGLKVARKRWADKKDREDKKEIINKTYIKDEIFGDYKASGIWYYQNEIPIWRLISIKNPNHKIYSNVYNLKNNKINLIDEDNDKDKTDEFLGSIELTEYEDEKENDNKNLNYSNSSIVLYEEKQVDLLSVPVYYHIAHCIPADLSFWGETANKIDLLYNMKQQILEYEWYAVKKGTAFLVDNVYNLIVTNKKFERPTLEDLKVCVLDMAKDCILGNVKYLAMPHIGCGHNKLNWEDVKPMILDCFEEAYNKLKHEYINIDENYFINILFCDNSPN